MIQCCRPFWLSQVLFPDTPVDPPEPGLCYNYFIITDPIAFIGWTFQGTMDAAQFLAFWNSTGEEQAAFQSVDANTIIVWVLLEEGIDPPSITITNFGGDPVAVDWVQAGCGDEALCYQGEFTVTSPDETGMDSITVLGVEFGAYATDSETYSSPTYVSNLFAIDNPQGLFRIFGPTASMTLDISGNDIVMSLTGIYLPPSLFRSVAIGAFPPDTQNVNLTEIPCP